MRKDKRGFSIAEVIVGLSLLSVGVLLIGSLSQQVSRLSNSTRQSGAVIQLRTKANSLSKDVTPWFDQLRASPITQGVFAGCTPESSANTSNFTCPSTNKDLLANDLELAKIAGSLYASRVDLVDNRGEQIAGKNPIYLDNDGRSCTKTNPSKNCPLQSTGYLLRQNKKIKENPGAIKLVVKVERNLSSTSNMDTTPMKPHFIELDVGTQWNTMSQGCPSKTIKIGYFSNGSPQCINPTASCPSGKISTGVEADGKPRCQSPPTDCADKSIVLDLNGDLICGNATDSPCEERQIFLGYFAGTGEAMCSSPDVKCNSGEVQVGLSTNSNGSLVAQCEKLPSCTDSQSLSYDGSKFVCQNASTPNDCLDGEVVVGINADGSPKCEQLNTEITNNKCTSGSVVTGINPDGSVICEKTNTVVAASECTKGSVVVGIKPDGSVKCESNPENQIVTYSLSAGECAVLDLKDVCFDSNGCQMEFVPQNISAPIRMSINLVSERVLASYDESNGIDSWWNRSPNVMATGFVTGNNTDTVIDNSGYTSYFNVSTHPSGGCPGLKKLDRIFLKNGSYPAHLLIRD